MIAGKKVCKRFDRPQAKDRLGPHKRGAYELALPGTRRGLCTDTAYFLGTRVELQVLSESEAALLSVMAFMVSTTLLGATCKMSFTLDAWQHRVSANGFRVWRTLLHEVDGR